MVPHVEIAVIAASQDELLLGPESRAQEAAGGVLMALAGRKCVIKTHRQDNKKTDETNTCIACTNTSFFGFLIIARISSAIINND